MNRSHPTPEIEILLVDAVNGESSPADAAALDSLLADDPGLRELLDEQLEVRSLLAVDAEPLGDLAGRRLRARVSGDLTPPRRWLLPVVAAGFVFVVAAGAILNGSLPFGGGTDATPPNLAATTFELDASDSAGSAESAGGATSPTSTAGASDAADEHRVAEARTVVEVADVEDVRRLDPLPTPTPASETGLACFADDAQLVVTAQRVVTPDGVIREVVVTTDDELLARGVADC